MTKTQKELLAMVEEMKKQNNRATQYPLFVIQSGTKGKEKFNLEYGVFFTAKACEECIEANDYHFKNPKSFGIGAYRNYEMQSVLSHLMSLTESPIPSHYKS